MFSVTVLLLLFLPLEILCDGYSAYWCYIQKTSCADKEHIGCQPNSFPRNTEVQDLEVISLSPDLKDLIVTMHNEFRNKLANGSLPGYSPAAQMNTLEWDDDLQETAEIFAQYGTYKHDDCRATETSPNAGQNIGFSRAGSKLDVTSVFVARVSDWFDEHTINSWIVKSYYPGTGAGHFTVLSIDRSTKIGCAATSFSFVYLGRKRYQINVVCNYEFNNVLGKATYTSGKSCSKCTKCNPKYTSLCASG